MGIEGLSKLRDKIHNGNKDKPLTEDDLPKVHDLFMQEYGYISVEDFGDMPIPMFNNLLNIIVKRREEQHKQMKKGNQKR